MVLTRTGSALRRLKPIVYPIEKTGLWGDGVHEKRPVVTNDYKSLVRPTKKGYPAGHVDSSDT